MIHALANVAPCGLPILMWITSFGWLVWLIVSPTACFRRDVMLGFVGGVRLISRSELICLFSFFVFHIFHRGFRCRSHIPSLQIWFLWCNRLAHS